MNQSKKTERIAHILGMLVVAYPSGLITDETTTLYTRMLSDIDPTVLETAVLQHIATSRFFPTVAELREAAMKIASPACQHPTSAEAWGEVKGQMRKVGWCGHPWFSDPLIYKIVAIFGWQELCGSENDEADRAHFMQMYQTSLEREKQDAELLPQTRTLRDEIRQQLAPTTNPANGLIARLADSKRM